MSRSPLLPGATIGLIGGGQLGRMLALEARRMEYRTVVFDPTPDSPAAQVADEQIVAELDDMDAALELARRSDIVTLEWENADLAVVKAIHEVVPVRPGPEILAVAQNRVEEKEAARRAGLGTAPFRAVRSQEDLRDAVAVIGTPSILKTASGGYDGKGQRLLRSEGDAASAFAELGAGDRELILEGFVDFELEVSVIVARNAQGVVRTFPVAENLHEDGVLDVTIVPARAGRATVERAREAAISLAEGLNLVGLLGVEMFATAEGNILINEIAPRPHNSGHFTWDACTVSQFELQLRTICDLPIDEPRLLTPCAMVNLFGSDATACRSGGRLTDAFTSNDLKLHLYGKSEARAGRKMGHITCLDDDVETAYRRALDARSALRADGSTKT